ncbi:hypothetical protein [Sphingomonas sp. CARO-RG-8B-R24-01]|uniref:hypothetical protein n=1 Tax=Sphingomonas sp. CARO-RG-8B-R24-01 TaxID=2914831 RepID=UPI001F56CE81|nr:hypothetical protein [Sphingomonas sp. CARO-RG-8B-R24-01]
MQFFEDTRGCLRPVADIKIIGAKAKDTPAFQPAIDAYDVMLSDGSSCTISAWQRNNLERIPSAMLPAAPDTYLLSPPGNPGEEDAHPWRTPVIAWAITSDGEVDPYSAEGRNGGLTDAPPILFPNGIVMDPHNQSWRSEGEWIRDVLRERQEMAAKA